MTKLTLERSGFVRVYEATWKMDSIDQVLFWLRDCGIAYEREFKEREALAPGKDSAV